MQRSQLSALQKLAVVMGIAVTLLPAVNLRAAAHERVLHRFTGGTDGAFPSSSLLRSASGHLYGTASGGGNANACTGNNPPGCGVVFELAPSANGKWQQSVLYAFHGGTDGSYPGGDLVFDSAGNIYGTTAGGGTNGYGTVFELSCNRDGSWAETVLYSFHAGSDGAEPIGLTIDASGHLYGSTTGVGAYYETVYELSPPQAKGGTWTEATLYTNHSFTRLNPGLVFDGKGNLYGSWQQLYDCHAGCGAVFELKRVGKRWQERDLYDFLGGGNGGQPNGVILDDRGRVYGTGGVGGNDFGIAFELKRSGGQWTEVMLYNFCSLNNCADGASPGSPLLLDSAGNLYGTTEGGGTGRKGFCYFCGVVFKLAHTNTGWTETVLHSFKGEPDGSSPVEGLALDGNGNLFGTTLEGGTGANGGYGTVFELLP